MEATSALEVEPVHYDMDHEIKGNWNPRNRRVANELCIAQNGRRSVVVAVKECQRLLLEKQKYGIEQLEVLGEIC